MTKEALTQLGLTEEQAENVFALHAETTGGLIPKEKLDEAEAEKTQLNAIIAERDKQLEELKRTAGLTDELRGKLDEAITKNKEDAQRAAEEIAEAKKESAVNMQLVKYGAKNLKAVKALLELEKVSVDGDNVIGLQEQLDTLRKTDAYLFEVRVTGREPYGGERYLPDEYKKNPFKKETFNLTEQGRLMRENPELAEKMKKAAEANN